MKKIRGGLFGLAVFVCLVAFFASAGALTWAPQGSTLELPRVFVSTGPTSALVEVDSANGSLTTLFTAKAGFRPEEISRSGDGLFICDSSNSEIFRFDLGDLSLAKIYDRDSAVSPADPEQPRACLVTGRDLFFVSRRGNGGSAKTGIWKIPDVVGPAAGVGTPELVFDLAQLGIGGEGLAVAPNGEFYLTFGNELWTLAPDFGSADETLLAGEGFGVASRGVSVTGPGGTSLKSEVWVALRAQDVIQGFFTDASGSLASCGTVAVPAGNNPNSMEFDLGGNLWLTGSRQTSGRDGSLFRVENLSCGPGGAFGDVVRLTDQLDAAVGVATDGGGDSGTLTFSADGDKSAPAELCSSLFTMQAGVVDSACSVEVSCRLMSQEEFEFRTDAFFSGTVCADFPQASGDCVEVRFSVPDSSLDPSLQCIRESFLLWQFFAGNEFDRPGLLFSPGTLSTPAGASFPTNDFEENVLDLFDPAPDPSDPLDPLVRSGTKDSWGSGVVVVDNAPNRAPVAVATAQPSSLQCSDPATTAVELDGTMSFDPEGNILNSDGSTVGGIGGWSWDFGAQNLDSGSDIGSARVTVTRADLGVGDNVFTFSVTDSDISAPTLTSSVDVSVEVVDNAAPTISGSVTADPATLWPPNHDFTTVAISITGVADDCASGSSLTCEIVGVTSTDPEQTSDADDKSPDWIREDLGNPVQVDAAGNVVLTLRLRAERSEGQAEGSVDDTRVYTVIVACSDGSNLTTRQVAVSVVSDQGTSG